MVSFLVGASIFLIISIVYVIRKRYIESRRAEAETRKKMECVTTIMPSQKYEQFVEEQ